MDKKREDRGAGTTSSTSSSSSSFFSHIFFAAFFFVQTHTRMTHNIVPTPQCSVSHFHLVHGGSPLERTVLSTVAKAVLPTIGQSKSVSLSTDAA